MAELRARKKRDKELAAARKEFAETPHWVLVPEPCTMTLLGLVCLAQLLRGTGTKARKTRHT